MGLQDVLHAHLGPVSFHDRVVLDRVGRKIDIEAPRVNDRRTDPTTGERARFSSAIVPPWARKSPKVVEALPLMYLHGLSTGDFAPALSEFFGSANGLSASVITRLTKQWQDEHRAFQVRSLADRDFVYVWADGVHFNVRLEEDRLCALVIVGVRLDGTKELVATTDGYRESTNSWADLLRDLKHRGMRAPVVAVGDGALGFWAALRDVFPEAREQRCWVHKIANVLNALPKSVQPTARKMLAEIRDAEDRAHAEQAIEMFADEFGAKWPKAVGKISDDVEPLLTFFDFPAEHWIHLKTTNPIESTFPRPCGCERVSRRAPARGRPAWRWRSSSSRRPRTDGDRSTGPSSSRSSAPAPGSSGGFSSRPRRKPRDARGHRAVEPTRIRRRARTRRRRGLPRRPP